MLLKAAVDRRQGVAAADVSVALVRLTAVGEEQIPTAPSTASAYAFDPVSSVVCVYPVPFGVNLKMLAWGVSDDRVAGGIDSDAYSQQAGYDRALAVKHPRPVSACTHRLSCRYGRSQRESAAGLVIRNSRGLAERIRNSRLAIADLRGLCARGKATHPN